MTTIVTVALLASLVLVFAGVDLWQAFHLWQARIGMGRWSDRRVWQQAVERRARRWMRRTPVVRITDNDRWVLFDMLRGRYRSRTIQSWQYAGLLSGLGEEESIRYSRRAIDPATGEWRHPPRRVDAALLAWVLNMNGTLSERARQTTLDLLTGSIKEEGTIPYRPDLPRVRFVDTIGMTVPLLVALGREDVAIRQVREYDRALMAGSPIPAHAFDLERGVPLGLYDWGRGVGWYALGLVWANKGGLFDDRVKALAAEMLRWQRPDGGFGARLFNDASPFESSATALMGLLMAEAHRITGEKRFLLSARAAERRLMQATRRTGEIDWCQGDTPGPGQYSRRMGIMPFAQGMALALSKELNGHEER